MRNINICLFNDAETVDSSADLYIVFFNRENFKKVVSTYKDFKPQYEHWYNVRVSSMFYDVIIFSKEDEPYYNPMLSLRNVLTPFVQDGKPRGWFYDENMKEVRFTGVGNSIYFNTKNDDGSISWECYKLFTDMYVENGDKITTNIKNTAPFDENALNLYNYRFCALKNQAEREKVFANNAANTKFRFGVCIN